MKRKLNNRGVTLVEILAAMVLLSIVAFPLVKTFLDSFKFQARSQIKTEANKVIEYVTEQIKNEKYSELGLDGDDIEKWAKGEVTEINEITIDSLPGSNLTAPYEVKIDKQSIDEVQKGGIGTPTNYELKMTLVHDVDGNIKANFIGYNEFIAVTYDANVFDIQSNIQNPINSENVDGVITNFYAILIDNQTGDPITINVKKQITDKVKIYTKGDVTLRQVADPSLSREQNFFEKVKLGNKEEIKDEKEYLCKAKITSTNLEDDTIYSSMNVTFSVFVEN